MAKSKIIFIIGILLIMIVAVAYFFVFKETPAAQYLRNSCESIKASPVSKGVDSNEKLLKRLDLNLNLANKVDEAEALDLALYIDDLREHVKLEKEIRASFLLNLQLEIALGILGDRSSEDNVDDTIDGLLAKSDANTKKLSQKTVGLRNAYIATCSKWIDIK